MIDAEDSHVGPAARTTLLHGFGRSIVDLHEADRTTRHAHGRLDHVARRTEAREAEAGTATRLVNQRHVAERLVDAFQAIRDGENEACTELTQRTARIHQRGAVRLELARSHHRIELAGRRVDLLHRGSVVRVDLGDDPCHAPEHVLRRLDDFEIVVLLQIPFSEYGNRVVGQTRLGKIGWGHSLASRGGSCLRLDRRLGCSHELAAPRFSILRFATSYLYPRRVTNALNCPVRR